MEFKKNSIGDILLTDLNQLKKDRDSLVEEIKDQYPNGKELDFIVKTITTENAIIKELEWIVEKYKRNNGLKK
mgnify:CR=1 FL=1